MAGVAVVLCNLDERIATEAILGFCIYTIYVSDRII